MKRTVAVLATAAAAAGGAALLAQPAHAATTTGSPDLVIARVFGAGGNSGSYYANDFVEVFNRGATPVTLAGWSIQYESSKATTPDTTKTTQLGGGTVTTLAPGGYLLVAGNANGSASSANHPLPTPDVSNNTLGIASDNATVLLVNPAGSVADEVGTGTAINFEGSAQAPGLTTTSWDTRAKDGCTDSDDNKADFTSENAGSSTTPGTITPRNSASPLNPCTTTPPALPEAPLAVGLPLAAVAVGGGLVAYRRRKLA